MDDTTGDQAAPPGRQRIRSYRRLPEETRRDEILIAAIATFGHNPDASLSDVADAAGISRTSLYRYFKTRQELLHVAFRRAGEDMVTRVRDVPKGPPSDILLNGLSQFYDHVEEHREAFLGFLQAGSSLQSEEIRVVAEQVRDQIGAMVYEALRFTETTPLLQATVHAWVAGVEATAIQWLRTGSPSRGTLHALMSAHLGLMLFNTATYDPVVAERIEWWMRNEPEDGGMALHFQAMADSLNRGTIANISRLLTGPAPR